jgi:CRISPR-associated exonuclease Cas4
LQHLLFCERRAALSHLEGIWQDNLYTAQGNVVHARVHDEKQGEGRGGVRITRGLRLRSLRLGLVGIADVVEFHRASAGGVALAGGGGEWLPFPVEYKRGRLRREAGYEVQLCAQALCLEEMLGATIPAGAIFYGKSKKRLDVQVDAMLRRRTEEAAVRLRELLRLGRTPVARYEKKCDKCSLMPLCLPKTTGGRRDMQRYMESFRF